MEKPTKEELLLNHVRRISDSINSLGRTIEMIDQNRRFPIVSPSDEMEERSKEQKKEQYMQEQIRILHNQNDNMAKTVKIAVYSVLVTAIVGVVDIVIKIFFNK